MAQTKSQSSHLTKWHLYDSAPQDFLETSPEHPLLLQVLYNRGLRSADEVKTFLQGNDAIRENPYKLKDMTPAVARIVKAIELGETICVYGDFDADGVTSTALMVTALQAVGARVGPYIPDRVDEGYGLNMGAIERVAAKANLMITVDCGIRSVDEVTYASNLGMDVIVTDHHSVGAILPPALAVINPRRADCTSNFQRLAGVGVAYRLAQAILREVAKQRWSQLDDEQAARLEEQLLDFVAIGTVADIMPLLGENRSLVQRGLKQLNQTERPGLHELLAVADLRAGSVDAAAIAFRIGPRLNAAGRLSNAVLAYKLLRTTEPTEAFTLAAELDGLNQQRRALTDLALAEAETQLDLSEPSEEKEQALPPITIVSSPKMQSGIVGLVAGRLCERFYRPSVVIEEGEQESRGSARSIAEFDISQGLDTVSDLLLHHGGHSRAAGFTVETKHLPAFKEALYETTLKSLANYEALHPTLHVDIEVTLDQLNWALHQQFARLEPTGNENPTPLLLCRNCIVRDMRAVGQGKHLKLSLEADKKTPLFDGIAFNMGEWYDRLSEGNAVDVLFYLEVNEWQGRRRLQLNIQDLRQSEPVLSRVSLDG